MEEHQSLTDKLFVHESFPITFPEPCYSPEEIFKSGISFPDPSDSLSPPLITNDFILLYQYFLKNLVSKEPPCNTVNTVLPPRNSLKLPTVPAPADKKICTTDKTNPFADKNAHIFNYWQSQTFLKYALYPGTDKKFSPTDNGQNRKFLSTDKNSIDYAIYQPDPLKLHHHNGSRSRSSWSNKVQCRLCQNRIMTNRLANLHNHARRHSKLKQFHCPYCAYAHTELAKVRLHMDHNHGDQPIRREPVDTRNEEMEKSWAVMMKKCFPDYA